MLPVYIYIFVAQGFRLKHASTEAGLLKHMFWISVCEKGLNQRVRLNQRMRKGQATFAKKAKLLREFCSRGTEGGGSALREYTANAPSVTAYDAQHNGILPAGNTCFLNT